MRNLLDSSRKPDLVFYNTGRIDISANVARHLRLSAGDVINIMTDGLEYYLYVQYRLPAGRYEAAVFPSNKNGKHFRTSSKRMCNAILDECKTSGGKVRLCIGAPVDTEHYGKMLPIITKHPLI